MTTQQMTPTQDTPASDDLTPEVESALTRAIEAGLASGDPETAWRNISRTILKPDQPFAAHLKAHGELFAKWDDSPGNTCPAPVWSPSSEEIDATNLAALMGDEELEDYAAMHRWSVEDVSGFWAEMIDRLSIHFMDKPRRVIADDANVRTPDWLPGAMLNISDSCFNAKADAPAIIHAREDGTLNTMSYEKLDALTSRVANGLVERPEELVQGLALFAQISCQLQHGFASFHVRATPRSGRVRLERWMDPVIRAMLPEPGRSGRAAPRRAS